MLDSIKRFFWWGVFTFLGTLNIKQIKMSVNKVMVLGHLGDDVKLHHFEDGGCIGSFPLATNEIYKNRNGEKVEETEWHQIVVRNKTAETLCKYLKKGDQVFVEGKIKTRKWQTDSGEDRYSTEIHAFSFSFVGKSDNQTKKQGEGDDVPF